MVTQRRWSTEEFSELFVQHPLLSHIVRRLVWVSDDGNGHHTGFRPAEDSTLANIDDEQLALPPGASIGIAHPLHLGEHLAAWADMFADYEILQPFPQLGREVYAVDEEAAFKRFEGVTVPTGKLLGLQKRGWERGQPQDAGLQFWVSKELPDGRSAMIGLSPGIAVQAAVDIYPEQELGGVWVRGDGSVPVPIASLDPVTASELFADLVWLTGAPGTS